MLHQVKFALRVFLKDGFYGVLNILGLASPSWVFFAMHRSHALENISSEGTHELDAGINLFLN